VSITSKAMHKKLIDAINLLGEYAEANLPPDFEIILRFSKTEATMDLGDPWGCDVDIPTADHDVSTFAEACETAKDYGSL
jgi:hypothetical protein